MMTREEYEDELIVDGVRNYNKDPHYSSWDFFRGLFLLTGIGKWLCPEEQRVFNKVWANKHQLLDPPSRTARI